MEGCFPRRQNPRTQIDIGETMETQTPNIKLGSKKAYIKRAIRWSWHMCPTCGIGNNQPFIHCSECGNHYPVRWGRCDICECPSKDMMKSEPDGKYTGTMHKCLYGFTVTPKQCREIQASRPVELIAVSLCLDCKYLINHQETVPF